MVKYKYIIYWIFGIALFIGWTTLVWGEYENKMNWMILGVAVLIVLGIGYVLFFGED